MAQIKASMKRRHFLKVTSMAGGGLMINLSWLRSFGQTTQNNMPPGNEEWAEINGFIKISPDNTIRILNPNPDFGYS